MSHNPTYDPEPGYNSYGGDRSGHSTPPQFYSSSTQPASEPFANMASYRQATTDPSSYGGHSAGNGKSYRYATDEPIPEDVESPVSNSPQVQFADLGTESKIPPKSSESSGSDQKFLILAVIAAVFALLFIIFLGLFIWKNSVAANLASDGQTGNKPTVAPVIQPGASTDRSTPSVNTPEQPTVPTTTPTVFTDQEELEAYQGQTVIKYTLSNKNGMKAAILSLGARLNMLEAPGFTIIPGMDTANNGSIDAIAQDTDGAWHGPVCGDNPTLHQEHFTKDETSDGSLKLVKDMNGMRIEFTYVLEESNKLTVTITATVTGSSGKIDICGSSRFNLDGQSDISNTQSIQIPASYVYQSNAWSRLGAGTYDLRSLTVFSAVIQKVLGANELAKNADWTYLLTGPTGMRHAATIGDGNRSPKVNIQTNQPVTNMFINLEDKSYVKVLFKSHPNGNGEQDVTKTTLEKGSMYEFRIRYEAV